MVNPARPFRFSLLWPLVVATCLTGGVAAGAERCDRGSFGQWKQTDHKDTRAQILVATAIGPVALRTTGNGKFVVESGSWRDAYSGNTYTDVEASRMEIDHVIPVCWAWKHGAADWNRDRKRAFYNDLTYLMVVEQGLNDQKSDKGPDEFVPLWQAGACQYVLLFMQGVKEYGLTLSPAEDVAFNASRDAACGVETALNG